MSTLSETHPRHNLLAFVIACFCMAACIWARSIQAERIRRLAIHWVAQEAVGAPIERGVESRFAHIKNQGMALQRDAFAQPDLLPFYGSSELALPTPDKAAAFFEGYPSGFEVFPVGKAGTTSLIILQKLAAVGAQAHGRKVAILISPGWFFIASTESRFYEGNFSMQQAAATIFSRSLSLPLKQQIARRMLLHRETTERNGLLQFAVLRLAGDQWLDRFLYDLALPLGWLQNAIFSLQDEREVMGNLSAQADRWRVPLERHPEPLNWEELIAAAAAEAQPVDDFDHPWPGRKRDFNASFRETMEHSGEWTDFDLLLSGLRELGVEPLLLCMPPNAWYFERQGVRRETFELFTRRLHEAADRHGARLVAFEDHLHDRTFLSDHHDHLSVKGWMFVNKTLDEFFHEKPKGH